MSYRIFYRIGPKALRCSGGSLDKILVPGSTPLLERSGTSLLGPKGEVLQRLVPADRQYASQMEHISNIGRVSSARTCLGQNLQSIVATLPIWLLLEGGVLKRISWRDSEVKGQQALAFAHIQAG